MPPTAAPFLTRSLWVGARQCFTVVTSILILASFSHDCSLITSVAALITQQLRPPAERKAHLKIGSTAVLGKEAMPLSPAKLRSNNVDEEDGVEISRREFAQSNIFCMGSCVAAFLLLDQQNIVFATDEDMPRGSDSMKPFAPLENLLPSTRVKVLIDNCVDIAQEIVNSKKEGKAAPVLVSSITKLEQYLLDTETFMTPAEVEASKRYLQIKTLTSWTRKRQDETRKQFEIDNVSPLTRANEAFEQWGERRQFRRLRRQQQAMETENGMRAALNSYTNNLVFGESYKLNADKQERRRLIRTYDQLPDVTSVVRSDLDLRDLYRNQILTKMDDARAECQYLKESNTDEYDELLSLLKEVQTACQEWFDFVPEKDKREALDIVMAEQKRMN
eukprot:CAMPEP_0178546758 /NCGR_PEP_ID=MMETSP0697-20121206/4321_1 /TAXON_ID=265572 /ORGANISM="Extubocellulus spinifer, Strain CCMP396" /LENGTH=389 /DNA_ID=CAMNT_0020179363 /DNA_START=36 /DNA_END=1205 /DNA_ORIENTATION=+